MVGWSIFWKVGGVALLLSCKVYTLVRKPSERLFLELKYSSVIRSSNSGGQFCMRNR